MSFFDDIEEIDKILAEANEQIEAEHKKRFEEPETYDEEQEKLVRDLITKIAYYAEDGSSFDPEGKYLCSTCSMRVMPDRCSHVSGDISMDTGTCEKWIIGPQSWPVQIIQWTQKEANYCERPEAKGFGCSRCGYASKAKKADEAGRDLWCARFGCRVQALACCEEEGGKDMVCPGE